MRVDIAGSHQVNEAYLQGLKNYPDASCRPERLEDGHLQFRLSLKDFYRCGTTQILNKITGTRTFYNRVVIESKGEEVQVLVKCQLGAPTPQQSDNHINSTLREKRDVLPAGFQEPEVTVLEVRKGEAPVPMLGMVVRQDGRVVGQELLVQPGAPLTMEVSLDSVSKDIYGILVSQLDVTDTGSQSEVILLNGCSVDPYLFENFFTTDGDLLTAKFRAFKFPDTNYVLFKGTVTVCLGLCSGTDCSNGQVGYGRRRRNVQMSPPERNRVYEVKMTTVLRIDNYDQIGNQRIIGSIPRTEYENVNIMEADDEESFLSNGSYYRSNEAKLTRNGIGAELPMVSKGSLVYLHLTTLALLTISIFCLTF
jgi:hypothetical protein